MIITQPKTAQGEPKLSAKNNTTNEKQIELLAVNTEAQKLKQKHRAFSKRRTAARTLPHVI